MNVPDSGSNRVRIMEARECAEQLHVRARSLDRDHIRIECGNATENIVELTIAHVRVDLRLVAYATGRETKCIDGPCQIGFPVRTAEREAFTQGGFVNLNNANARRFEVEYFVTQGKANLLGGFATWLVIADEAPLENRDGARKHSLHGLTR